MTGGLLKQARGRRTGLSALVLGGHGAMLGVPPPPLTPQQPVQVRLLGSPMPAPTPSGVGTTQVPPASRSEPPALAGAAPRRPPETPSSPDLPARAAASPEADRAIESPPTAAPSRSPPLAHTAPAAARAAPPSPREPGRTNAAPPPDVPPAPPRFDADYLDNPRPAYPPISRRLGETGRILLRVRVSEKGLPERVEIEEGSGYPRLDNAAREAVSGWRFVPAHRGGDAVAAWVGVPIVFNLDR